MAGLASDKAHLQQQCDNRSSHALTLIAENKRLLEQVKQAALARICLHEACIYYMYDDIYTYRTHTLLR